MDAVVVTGVVVGVGGVALSVVVTAGALEEKAAEWVEKQQRRCRRDGVMAAPMLERVTAILDAASATEQYREVDIFTRRPAKMGRKSEREQVRLGSQQLRCSLLPAALIPLTILTHL